MLLVLDDFVLLSAVFCLSLLARFAGGAKVALGTSLMGADLALVGFFANPVVDTFGLFVCL